MPAGTSNETFSRAGEVAPLYLKITFENSTCPWSGVRTPLPERPSSAGWLTSVGDKTNSQARLVVLLHELSHLHQWPDDPHGEQEEGKEGADIDRIVGAQDQIHPKREGARNRQPLQRPHHGLYEVGGHALGKAKLCNAGNVHVPHLPLFCIESERLNGANAMNILDQKCPALDFGTLGCPGLSAMDR